MKQYKKNYEIKNRAKDRLEGRYGGAIRILFLSTAISWMVRLIIRTVAGNTMNSVYAMTSSSSAATVISFVFDGLLLFAGIILGVMNAGITLYFLNLACEQPFSIRDLFYGFRTDSRKILIISAAMTICQAICLSPGQYLFQQYLSAKSITWLFSALAATAVGLCIYIPVSLGIAMSFYLVLDFPQNSGWETLQLCWRIMRGQRGRLFYLELSFLPLMLLCILSFGIGFLWLEPYMQMTYTYFFLDLMNPQEKEMNPPE